MKFSVIVPVYNVEKYIDECVQSVLKQSYQDFELVLVDDGSTDSSGSICDRYARLYPEQVRVIHKQNQGPLAARITGISGVKGDFCIFADSDDFIEEDLLKTVNSYLEKDHETDILLYSFRYYRDGQKAERFPAFKPDGYIWKSSEKTELYEALILTNQITSIWTKAIRTSILQRDPTEYTEYYGKNMAEDLLQSLYPLTAAGKIIYCDKVLYNYRINTESISRAFRYETIPGKITVHVYHEICKYLPAWGMDTQETRERLNARWFNDTFYLFSKYYEKAVTWKDRKRIMDYNWNSFLPNEEVSDNKLYINIQYQKIYEWINRKRYVIILLYFIKKKLYQRWKKRRK